MTTTATIIANHTCHTIATKVAMMPIAAVVTELAACWQGSEAAVLNWVAGLSGNQIIAAQKERHDDLVSQIALYMAVEDRRQEVWLARQEIEEWQDDHRHYWF